MNEQDLASPKGDLPPQEPQATQYFQIKYESPLPPPRMLREYEEFLPGAADRIFNWLEKQSDHRQHLERKKLEADIASEKRGQVFGFLLAAAAISGSFVLIWTGKNVQGIILFITTFASLVGVFVIGKVKQGQELAKKRRDIKDLLLRHAQESEDDDETPEPLPERKADLKHRRGASR